MTAAAGPQVLVSAGDASGDLHAADFVRTFRARSPGARFFGLGGPALEKAGVELVCSQRDLAIGGLVEIAGGLGRVVRAWRRLTSALAERQADLVLLVDSGGFNLPFARRAHAARAPVLYYVAPQVWAWRTGRIRKLARRVDQVAVIFPFEVEVYRGTGVAATFVGHPLVDPMRELCGRLDRAGARRALGLEVSGSCVALLPGSRRNEIGAHLRTQLATARLLHERDPRSHFVLAVAPSLTAAGLEAAAPSRMFLSSMFLARVFLYRML